jgi:hypothetical protein
VALAAQRPQRRRHVGSEGVALHCPVFGGPRPAARASRLQARRAARTVGELAETPVGRPISPVMGLGSGKFVTPCERMQRDTARSFSIAWGLTTCVVGVVGRWPPLYFAQARDAAMKVGEVKTAELLKALMTLSEAPGSGKFGTL